MATETEAKMRFDDLDAVARRLKAAGAKAAGQRDEVNVFFDTPNSSLRKAGKGLRLRTHTDRKTGRVEYVVTFKGPRRAGKLKIRTEIEFTVDNPDSLKLVFAELGFRPMLTFKKWRRSWAFMGCKVELDQLPRIGKFVEIEGPTVQKVMAARKMLKMEQEPLITESYASMTARHLAHKKPRH
jgi:adenylate cyclase class 2